MKFCNFKMLFVGFLLALFFFKKKGSWRWIFYADRRHDYVIVLCSRVVPISMALSPSVRVICKACKLAIRDF